MSPDDTPPLDLMLVARYGLLVSLTHLIPIPVLDWLVEGWLRNRLTRVQLHGFEVDLPRKDVSMLASGDAGGCLGLVWSIVSWPFRRLLRYVLWVLIIKAMIDTFSDVVARAILVHEACAVEALPGDAVRVRAAMQRARRGLNTKPIERAVGIVYRSLRGQLWKLWRQARGRMRQESRRARRDEDWTAEDEAPLDAGLESVSEALARAVWVPEVHQSIRTRFREELVKDGLISEEEAAAEAEEGREVTGPDAGKAAEGGPADGGRITDGADPGGEVTEGEGRDGEVTEGEGRGGESASDGPHQVSDPEGGPDAEPEEADRRTPS